jgi:hypothetical protein
MTGRPAAVERDVGQMCAKGGQSRTTRRGPHRLGHMRMPRSAYLAGIGRLTSTPSFKNCNSTGPLLRFLEGNGK